MNSKGLSSRDEDFDPGWALSKYPFTTGALCLHSQHGEAAADC